MSTKSYTAPFSEVRRIYREKAAHYAAKLQRSLNKSCDTSSYTSEIELQNCLCQQIMYLQQCRMAIETAITDGLAEVSATRSDGEAVSDEFVRQSDNSLIVTTTE